MPARSSHPRPAVAWLAAMVAGGLSGAAEARDISGQLAYRERIALPPDAMLLVEATDGFGKVLARLRAPTAGAQVPLAFTLEVPDDQDVLVRSALVVGHEIRWLSEPRRVAGSRAATDLGTIPLAPHKAMGFSSRLRCGDTSVEAGYRDDGAVLRLGARQFDLLPEATASGAKFTDPADPGTWLWSKGDALSVSLRGTLLGDCAPADPAPDGWRAGGNEPDWTLAVAAGHLSFAAFGETALDAPLPAAGAAGSANLFRLDEIGLGVTVAPGPCRDTMTGMPHPDRVTIAQGTAIVTGCGGDPASLLTGLDWQIVEAGGTTLPEGAEASLRLTSGGAVSGRAACNRFTGHFTLTGEGLRLVPGGVTRMACPEPLMAAEGAILDALGRIDRFDFDAAGDLLLIGGEGVLLRARL